MKLLHSSSGPLHVNTYFLVNEEKNSAIVVDCGENYKLIKQTEEKYGFKIKAVLLTHAHFDHSGCAKKLQDGGAEIYISKKDAPKLSDDGNLACMFGRKFENLIPDRTFNDGEDLIIEDIKIKALVTPGHTDGSACFIVGDAIFTGDTLFNLSVGRTDFKTGDREAIVRSVKRLFAISGDYAIYPGHDGFTTLSFERENNVMSDYD